MSKFSTFLRKASSRNLIIALAVTVTVAAIGYIVIATHAAGPFASVDLSTTTPTSPAQIVSDSGTASGKAIQFSSAVTTPPNTGNCNSPYPNVTCTGIPNNTTFAKKVNGDYFATTDGEVIDKWQITGDLVIQAKNVTITNSEIDGHIDNDSLPLATSFNVTDSTIGPPGCSTQGWPSINGHDFTATRVWLRGHQDAVDMVGNNVTVNDSLLQPCFQPASVVGSDGFHSDGIQDQCGGLCTHVSMTHNTFNSEAFDANGIMTGNSTVYLGSPYNGTGNNVADVTLKNNLFLGGGYSMAILWNNIGDKANWTITDNAWVKGDYAYNKWVPNQWAYGTWAFGPVDTEGSCSHINWSGNKIVTVVDTVYYNIASTVGPQDCVN